MLTKKRAGRGAAILGLTLLFCLLCRPQVQALPVWGPVDSAVSDSLSEQERDSLIFQLNLQYLNQVNEHGTPYELIAIIEEILEMAGLLIFADTLYQVIQQRKITVGFDSSC